MTLGGFSFGRKVLQPLSEAHIFQYWTDSHYLITLSHSFQRAETFHYFMENFFLSRELVTRTLKSNNDHVT